MVMGRTATLSLAQPSRAGLVTGAPGSVVGLTAPGRRFGRTWVATPVGAASWARVVPEIHQLSRADARRIAVRAQLLDSPRPSDLLDTVRALSMFQLDPISSSSGCA